MSLLLVICIAFIPSLSTPSSFILCAHGHQTSNKLVAGKTTFFQETTEQANIWKSYNTPPETSNVTYIYQDLSNNQSCWSFGVTSEINNIINRNFQQFGIVYHLYTYTVINQY